MTGTADQPKRYTLDEARRELKRQECAIDKHRPVNMIATIGDPIGEVAYCECGDVAWYPRLLDKEVSR